MAGLPAHVVGTLTPAEIALQVEGYARRRQALFFDMLNAVGYVMHGKKWRHVHPPEPGRVPDDFDVRWDRAMQRRRELAAWRSHHGRL